MNGEIVVYTGPMFASKSGRLINMYEKCKYAKRNVLAFKPKMDNRFGEDVIVARKIETTIPAINILNVAELLNYDAEIYIIDEFEFLEGDVSIIQDMANEGKIFHIAGLDMTAEGKPFGLMPDILAIADQVMKEVASCVDCGSFRATHSFYLGRKNKDIVIGDNEYIALCRSCWAKRMHLKKKGII
ncbi:MAG: hypothetical protein IJ220_00135 [Clostridia bacterium]|nr:hypothetical protein [Clostridia bacterium]